MSFNINNTNFQCAPMYNKNQNNQVMGYLCSADRNVEGFDNGQLFDTFKRNTVKSKDDGLFWKYLGAAAIVVSGQNEAMSSLTINLSSPTAEQVKTGLTNMKKNISGINEDTLPYIFLFHKAGKTYVMRTTNWVVQNNQLILQASRSKGIADSDFQALKGIGDQIELRVGVASINDNSQRSNIGASFDN